MSPTNVQMPTDNTGHLPTGSTSLSSHDAMKGIFDVQKLISVNQFMKMLLLSLAFINREFLTIHEYTSLPP